MDVKVMRRDRVALLALGLSALACFAAPGCGSRGSGAAPRALLSSSVEAQSAFQRLLREWAPASRSQRIAMAGRIAAFRAAYPKDALSAMASALLAWVKLEQGDYAGASAEAAMLQATTGPGTTQDLGRTIQGAALRRRGEPERALALLSPLVSKLIDPYARALFNEEIVASALAARRFSRALALMKVWLREAGADEREAVIARIENDLGQIPAEELLRMLDGARGATLGEDEQTMQEIVALRLATVARERRDAKLAQRLIERSGALLGEHGDAVAELATGASRARIEPRTIGLLVSLQSEETRRRAAAVVDGVAYGLELPGSAARLVSRDDRGTPESIEEALVSLSAEGASVVIAGVADEDAEEAARFAEANRMPVILLRPPLHAPMGKFTFVLGPDPAAVEATLAGAPSLPKGSLVATAGLFPLDPAALPEAISPWMKNHAAPPDLWAALGRDAGKLAWAAVMALPAQGTQEPQEVVAQRTKAAEALAAATLDLWTTEARGFGGARVMPRTLGVRER